MSFKYIKEFINDRIWFNNSNINNLEKENSFTDYEISKQQNIRRIIELTERNDECKLILNEIEKYESNNQK